MELLHTLDDYTSRTSSHALSLDLAVFGGIITPVCSSMLSLSLPVYQVNLDYCIAGNFQGVLIFIIFMTIPRVMKFSTHEFSVGYCAALHNLKNTV